MYAMAKVEREVIDKLDELICDGRGDDEYKQLFTATYASLYLSFQFN